MSTGEANHVEFIYKGKARERVVESPDLADFLLLEPPRPGMLPSRRPIGARGGKGRSQGGSAISRRDRPAALPLHGKEASFSNS